MWLVACGWPTQTLIHGLAGGYFDPLNLASGDEERAFRLKTAEIKHGRLAMVAFFGFGVQVRGGMDAGCGVTCSWPIWGPFNQLIDASLLLLNDWRDLVP
jgi:hypothetical protein